MSQHSISNSLFNIVLVIAESILTLILRFDPNLRRAAYPLAQKNVTVALHTYLPHTTFYATFTNKGVLLDIELPRSRDTIDVVINTYTHELLNAFISADSVQVDKFTMRGDIQAVAEVRHFLTQLNIISLFRTLIQTIKGKNQDDTDKASKKEKSEAEYKTRIEEQKQQLNTLSIRNRELEMTVKEVQSKQKVMLIALVVMSLIAIVALVGWLT